MTVDLALQLLTIIDFMMNNDLNYFFYFTHVDADTFGVFNNGQLFIQDASMLGVIDKQEGIQMQIWIICHNKLGGTMERDEND